MKVELRNKVYNKYNGRCAYTGKPLDNDWQVDHITPQRIFDDNMDILKSDDKKWLEAFKAQFNTPCIDKDDIRNLLPALQIVNHYKRALDIEGFREYLKNFHIRLSKLPKKTNSERTKKRIAYMNEVANAFDITIDNPFDGLFYFETL